MRTRNAEIRLIATAPRRADARRSRGHARRSCGHALQTQCTSQKSVFRRRTFARQQKSGGRKPPVGCIRCERETRKFVSLQLQTRAADAPHCLQTPRRADARRSHCGHALSQPCTSQKSVFRRRTFARQQKSGGRKPPVGCIRYERETRKFVSLQLQTRAYKHTAGSRPPLLFVRRTNTTAG
jgi:hypothetical protein